MIEIEHFEESDLDVYRSGAGEFIALKNCLPDHQRRRRGRKEPPAIVAAYASDGRHTPCPPTRCQGCGGQVLELPCRLCEIREEKRSEARGQRPGKKVPVAA